MARYIERLEELLEEGVLTQEQHDELADLSVAKEAIKEFNQVKRERDDLSSKLTQFETAPKRKEALKRVGIDYDAQPRYGQKTLDSIPTDRLDDLEFVASFVKDEGFEANLQSEQEGAEGKSGAERIVEQATSAGSGAPPSGQAEKDAVFHADLDKVPDGDREALREVLAKHGRLAASEG